MKINLHVIVINCFKRLSPSLIIRISTFILETKLLHFDEWLIWSYVLTLTKAPEAFFQREWFDLYGIFLNG